MDDFCKNHNNNNRDFNYQLNFSDYTFKSTDTYKTLLSNSIINNSNIIIIDSRLFENENSNLSKFTGEQFKIILRQVLPFIKTIVISQNIPEDGSLTIKKFQANGTMNTDGAIDYYNEVMAPVLNSTILAIIEEFEVLQQLTLDNEVDPVLIGTIQSTITGLHDTALFEKEDLDKLIDLFNEVKANYDY
ncbi:hypothetical protein AB1K81_10670 [Ornithinibacillus sp. 179-J 7C1 HS]